MIRVFNHYIHRHALLQMVFDVGFIYVALLAIIAAHIKNPSLLLSLSATHGLSLATSIFVINCASGFYQPARDRPLYQSMARAGLAALLGLPLAYGIFRLIPESLEPSADTMAYAAMAAVLLVIAHRVYVAHAGATVRPSSRILVLGCGPAAELVSRTLTAADPQAQIVGYYPSPNERESTVPSSRVLAGCSLADVAARENVSEIVVALTERRGGSMSLRDLLDCKIKGIRVSDLSTHFEKTLGQIHLGYVNAGWLIFGDGFDQGLLRTAVKRVFDIVAAAVLLFAAAPIMLVTALLIMLDSPGPALYRQQRVGLNGKPFDIVKFRSMRADAEKDGQPRWASAADDRITRVGRVLRMLRIDELPQLFNVLKGDMSIVGPRPERPFFVESLTREIPFYAVRHSVKPGVTGWAQVRYHYGSTVEDSQQKLQYDLYYVKNHTLFLDLLILFETVSVVLTGKGAR